jgi:hypothetical protein
MTLPTRNGKDYLTITGTATGLAIVARKPHADELHALFAQYGLACEREADVGLGEDLLRLEGSADRLQAGDVLESYKLARGS